MKILKHKPNTYKTSQWAGGSTTELFIAPNGADYANRDFDFRISSAKVELPSSDFTPLPRIERKLMVLEGSIIINHKNHYTKTLNKFDVDSFSGDWQTSSQGTCTDFNLMTNNGVKGEIESLLLSENQSSRIENKNNWKQLFVYVLKGSIDIQGTQVEQFHLLQIEELNKEEISIQAQVEGSELVLVWIK